VRRATLPVTLALMFDKTVVSGGGNVVVVGKNTCVESSVYFACTNGTICLYITFY